MIVWDMRHSLGDIWASLKSYERLPLTPETIFLKMKQNMKPDGAKQLYSLQNFVTTLLILSKSQQNEKRRLSFRSFVLIFSFEAEYPTVIHTYIYIYGKSIY